MLMRWTVALLCLVALQLPVLQAHATENLAGFAQFVAKPTQAISEGGLDQLVPSPVVMLIGYTQHGHYPVLLCRAGVTLPAHTPNAVVALQAQPDDAYTYQVLDTAAIPVWQTPVVANTADTSSTKKALQPQPRWSVAGTGGQTVTLTVALPKAFTANATQIDLGFLLVAIPKAVAPVAAVKPVEAAAIATESATKLPPAKATEADTPTAEEADDDDETDNKATLPPVVAALQGKAVVFAKALTLNNGRTQLSSQVGQAAHILMATSPYSKPLAEPKLLSILHPKPATPETVERKVYRMEFDVPTLSQFFLKKFTHGGSALNDDENGDAPDNSH
jgi:hypothetical protein